MIGQWVQEAGYFGYQGGAPRGRSASEPFVVTAWGPASDPRPILRRSSLSPYASMTLTGGSHARFVSLHIDGEAGTLGSASVGNFEWRAPEGEEVVDRLVEDCYVNGSLGGTNLMNGGTYTVRRCVVTNAWSDSSHIQGFYVFNGATGEQSWTLEECVFDRNGYKENPNAPQTWTGNQVVLQDGSNALAAGTGVQPRRTYYDRNLYVSRYGDVKVRGCIIGRGGGGNSFQLREGAGVVERNVFLWNESAIYAGSSNETTTSRARSTLVRRNLLLHDDHLLPPGGWGNGIIISGGPDDLGVVDDNVIAHFHRGNNGEGTISARGSGVPQSPVGRVVIKDNAIFREYGGHGIDVLSTTSVVGVLEADVTGNEVSTLVSTVAPLHGLQINRNATRPAASTYSGNQYHSAGPAAQYFTFNVLGNNSFTKGDLTAWKAAGFDSDATQVYSSLASFKTAVGWTAPERDIVSYMQSVDPTYVPNEEVFVDDDSTGPKQAVRTKVREMVMTGDLAASFWGSPVAMTDARARQLARRYHAMITFMQRAKANRKGAWDSRYTADALNNHVRDGFGKTAVGSGSSS